MPVNTVSISEDLDQMNVSLWRGLSNKKLIRQYVQIQSVVVNSFRDEVSVLAASRTVMLPI